TALSHVLIGNVLIEIVAGKQWHLRLENGGSRCDGRVEIYHDGTWGRLLDDSWNISNADVICRQLNFGSAISVYNSSQYGEGTGPVWINNVQCAGTETHIWNCPYSTVASSSRTSRDVGVLCSGECTLVINNKNPCKFQHRFVKYLTTFLPFGSFCSSNDVETLNNFSFQAAENTKTQTISFPNWKRVVFLNFETDHKQLRLVDDGSSCSGTVEVYRLGDCRRVRDQFWDLNDANMVCRQLGCGPAIRAYSSPVYREGEWSPWLKDVRCSGKESALWECASSPWGQHDCGHKEDVSIVCSGHNRNHPYILANNPPEHTWRFDSGRFQHWSTEHKMLRLVNGQHSCEGRVEAAEVICKQLDCEGSGPIWLDDIACNSNESFLWQCSSPPWGEHNCDHREDVGVICSGNSIEISEKNGWCETELRLVGGSSSCSGRVEILSNNTWGTVCDDSWDIREASVVCGQLDCGPAVRAVGQAGFGQGAGQIWLDELHCRGSESFLWDCVSSSAGHSDCVHKEDAGVVCSGRDPISQCSSTNLRFFTFFSTKAD
uniref:SRCR domain-containing protein n=1 Tax=Callorhinchus milii TaxID=7868 RepID=A0A4W3GQ81_CALMI